ncbi:hypothetical protein [Asticcacaulis taihuensis]|uniref:Urate oxidase N-terminal domain-containing protein n=1 Tax=Asticcacaulis taihuensis TaxID=260084 RepID=A0A1G4Q0S0_9CAUL|nr:hypothetical protein [Asticcacaulis taihuensis]SCW38156.1 hypothetical protein SAMN02927928_0827 [Asticcacaulis taihuensis]
MAGFLSNLRNVMIVSLLLAIVVMVGFGIHSPGGFDVIFLTASLRWAHVLSGVLWIGLLYYFNFVQIRVMPDIPADLKPAVSKYIAPEALFWFRYAALFTVVFGLALAWLRGYIVQAMSFGFASLGPAGYALGFDKANAQFIFIGVGMWLGLIMFFNVWHMIWPAQKIALGIREGFTPEQKAAAAKKAMIFSRINTLLSLPMLASMAMYQTIFG